jgi:isopentenyldiphosphate isomerase
MKEYIDIIDNFGKSTGESIEKDEAHRLGKWHNTAHIWIYNSNGEILFQKRAYTKNTFPGLWDISVAGHISAGETVEDGACREVLEEVGLKVNINELEKVFVFKESYRHDDLDWNNNEFHHVFLYKYKGDITSLVLQKEEVDSVKFIHFSTLLEEFKKDYFCNDFVGDIEYYKKIISLVVDRIKS